ncbi:sugar phosphate isomerase/epimerase family protein [Xylanivirga thermophila]|uniref:sugar phosphate isomerase/epimerase family protein n=1 Tax=Xylanivirga thermophila TaxID=2496273 RepID=UPI001FB2FD76|nr:sugar phosphate isomerase/epimerase [Xylanivirga thermophila]
MKIGVSAYSYSQCDMDAIQIVHKAKEMEFDYIEFSGLPKLPENTDPVEYAKKIKQECDKVGLTIVNYAVGADLLNNDLDQEVERLKREVDVAKELGSPCMRHDATWGFANMEDGPKGFDNALPVLIKGYRAVTEYAEQLGIKTTIENHGFFCQDSERVEKLILGVGHPNFGLLLDVGNFLCVDEDPVKAVGRLLPYVFHAHAKDFHIKSGMVVSPGDGWFRSRGGNYLRGSIIGHGNAPVFQCIGLLKRAGYDGVLSIEFEGLEDPIKGIAIGKKNLEHYIELA